MLRLDTTTAASASGAAPAVDGASALVVYEHDGQLSAVRSSDRGISWSAPVRVDQDPTASFKFAGRNSGNLPLALRDDRAHAVWRDTRNGDADLCYARSLDGGATWGAELMLDEGATVPGSPVRDFSFAATTVAGVDQVHVLFTVDDGNSGPEQLLLVSSRDGGSTFEAALAVSSVAADVDQIHLAVDGQTLHCAWIDDRAGADDVYYRRSLDGGLTFTAPELQLDATPPANGDAEDTVRVVAEDAFVAVGWLEEIGSSREQAQLAVSTDTGTSFSSPRTLGGYLAGIDDVDELELALSDGVLYAAWADDRSGLQNVYVTRSNDQGSTFSTEFGTGGTVGSSPRLTAIPGFVAVTWLGGDTSGLQQEVMSRSSRDDGLTWSGGVDLSTNTGDADLPEMVLDPLYGNLIACWLADDLVGPAGNNVFAGGFRPQTQIEVGWQAGPTVGRFDFSGFDGTAPFVWVLGSNSPGSFSPRIAGDPRSTGLTLDDTLLFTLEFGNLFVGTLDSEGTGSTPSFPIDLPVGTTLYTMAISVDLTPVRTVEFSDVLKLVL